MAKKPAVVNAARDMQKDLAAAAALKHQMKEMFGEDGDVELLHGMIEGETGLLETIDAVICQVALDMANIDGLKKFATTIAGRKKRLEDRVENLRSMLLNALDILDEKKFERPIATITRKDTPPQLLITDEAAIPSNFYVTADPSLDRKGLLDALKARRDTLQQKLDEITERHQSEGLSEETASELHDRIVAAFPAIPGAELDNGGATVQIRFS